MQLIYYRREVPNFGDDLNAHLWDALAPGLFRAAPDAGFVGIGTIIGMPCGPSRLHVFTSGVGYDPLDRWRGKQVEYWCVRGPLSVHLLGLAADRALTDGAILVPLTPGFPRQAPGAGADADGAAAEGTVVVPHWETMAFPGWPEAVGMAGLQLIDPRGDAFGIVRRIASARLVLTESLHGAIIADTYGVPWIAFAATNNFSVFKWSDWTQSVGLDLRFATAPPPDAAAALRYGRPARPYGRFLSYGPEAAVEQFRSRGARAAPPWRAGALRGRLKRLAAGVALGRSALGFSPARTAEVLARLARAEPSLSTESRRQELQSRLMDRLRKLAATYGG